MNDVFTEILCRNILNKITVYSHLFSYWFPKHCLHYTFIYSVFCISQFQKSYLKVYHFIRRLKRCLREGRHLRHIIFLKQYFPLPILSFHVSWNIELTPLSNRLHFFTAQKFLFCRHFAALSTFPGFLTHSITLTFFITIVSVNFTLRFSDPLWLKLESCNFYQSFWIYFY